MVVNSQSDYLLSTDLFSIRDEALCVCVSSTYCMFVVFNLPASAQNRRQLASISETLLSVPLIKPAPF